MSISKQVTIWCDDCGKWEQWSATATAMRKKLKSWGWTSVKKSGDVKDYCIECSKKRETV